MDKRTKYGKKLTPEEWRSKIEEWKKSGKTVVEFCMGQNLTASTLRYWYYKFNQNAKKTSTPLFSEIKLNSQQNKIVRIILPNGVQIHLTDDSNVLFVEKVIKLFGISSC